MTWYFHSHKILKNNLSCLPVLSITCVAHCWLQGKLGRGTEMRDWTDMVPKGKE